jgi:hypothetical protein
VAVGVDHHPNRLLRLDASQAGAAGLRPPRRGGQVVDADVEMLRHGLPPLLGRPHWALEAALELEVEGRSVHVRRRLDLGPSLLLGAARRGPSLAVSRQPSRSA